MRRLCFSPITHGDLKKTMTDFANKSEDRLKNWNV